MISFEGRQQDDEHERRPLPDVADHHRDPGTPRIVDPSEVLESSQVEERHEGPLPCVRQHPEHVRHPDRRDRHRQQEHDPKEPLATQALGGKDGKAQPEQVLDGDADEDVDEGDEQGSGPATLGEKRLREQPHETHQEQACDRPQKQAEEPDIDAAQI